MTLASGTRLGPFEIIALLGAGGMGEVYRARDRKLNRDVALKILPETFASDGERLARFRNEAQVLAALSHPNIGHIYGFEDSGPTPALVLELIPGPTLADRIAQGSLPLSEASAIARQIAEALESAHGHGIVHRDLKPANIKVQADGVVKVLDFGLAKFNSQAEAGPRTDGAQTPTFTSPPRITQPGVVLGTAAYMSPEQARGLPVDKRTDIWAFGCVLYEMLTGRAAFAAETVSDMIVAILSGEPDWEALPADTPAGVRLLLQRCLEKNLKRRLRDIGDARLELDQPDIRPGGGGSADFDRASSTAPVTQAPSRLRRLQPLVVAAAVAVVGLVAAGVVRFKRLDPPAPSAPAGRDYVQITNYDDSATAPSFSPDGRMVTFIRGGEGFLSQGQVHVKLLPHGESVPLTTNRNLKYGPVFTPDGSRIAYTELTPEESWDTWTVPVLGGPPRLLLPNASGLTWIRDQQVLFAEIKGSGLHMGIVTASETRGQSRDIYIPDHENAMAHYAYLSPDHRSLLVVEMDRTHTFNQPCRLLPFDGSSAGRQVGPKGFCTSAAWSPDGQWMYFGVTIRHGSHIWRQRFPDGTPEQVTSGPSEEDGIAVAPDGRSLITSIGTRRSAIWLHDANGDRALQTEGFTGAPRLSRDGTRVSFLYLRDLSATAAELRAVHLASGKVDTLLPGVSVTDYDISRDERELAFTVLEPDGRSNIWLGSLDRRAAPRQVVADADQVSFGANNELIYRSLEKNLVNVLGRSRTDGSNRERLTSVPVLDKFGVSPDGRWAIVYSPGDDRVEPGTFAVPLSAPRLGDVRPVRICSGCPAFWSADGKFFYVTIEQSSYWSPRASWALAGSASGKTLAIAVPEGRSLPDLPATGIDPRAAGADVKGARVIPRGALSPGLDPSTYVFAKMELLRNLYRITLP